MNGKPSNEAPRLGVAQLEEEDAPSGGGGENDDDLLPTASIHTPPKSLLGMSSEARARLDADAERLVSEAVVDEVVPLRDGTERVTYEVKDVDVACNGGDRRGGGTPTTVTAPHTLTPTTVIITPRPHLDTHCFKLLATNVCIPVKSTRILPVKRLLISRERT